MGVSIHDLVRLIVRQRLSEGYFHSESDINAILDKISRDGYESLDDSERAILDNFSKNDADIEDIVRKKLDLTKLFIALRSRENWFQTGVPFKKNKRAQAYMSMWSRLSKKMQKYEYLLRYLYKLDPEQLRSYERKLNEINGGGLRFHTDHKGAHHGQNDMRLSLLRDGKEVGYLDYSIFQGEVRIDYIKVVERKQGYGRMLVDQLANEYGGYENINWSSMTPDGAALRASLDREKRFDRQEHENKHYKKAEIIALLKARSIDAARFFEDITNLGSQATWKKWESYLGERGYPTTIDGIDLNDLDDLSAWTRDSVENHNLPRWEPKEYITDFVKMLSL